jgi:aspartyl aminopeptidase
MALCEEKEIPYQRFVKHSNVKGGGTIGSIISSHLPMRTADLGVGLLAMHSSREMMGVKDQTALMRFVEAFFE